MLSSPSLQSLYQLASVFHIILFLMECAYGCSAFTSSSFSGQYSRSFFHTPTFTTARYEQNDDNADSSIACSMYTHHLKSTSGKPVCRYALGGAARSVQPESLPLKYHDMLSQYTAEHDDVAPFYFYYNPHRYPAFLSGISKSLVNDNNNPNNSYREDVFIASGGTERSPEALEGRLSDALVHSGGEYLDAFILEYICPYELGSSNNKLGEELEKAIEYAHELKRDGKVRYVMASTHSHKVGSLLASAKMKDNSPAFDALMLRYSMSHKNAAELLSLPKALEHEIPVLAFTTTRWNRLQSDPPQTTTMNSRLPTTADCLKFALQNPAIDIVLHSARDEEELEEALLPLISSSTSGQISWLSKNDYDFWRAYGDDEMAWNEDDAFDEYPEESVGTGSE